VLLAIVLVESHRGATAGARAAAAEAGILAELLLKLNLSVCAAGICWHPMGLLEEPIKYICIGTEDKKKKHEPAVAARKYSLSACESHRIAGVIA
jgi:hypothetical protein